jgi:hypothetical protein
VIYDCDLLDCYLILATDGVSAAVLKELQKVGFDLQKSEHLNKNLRTLVTRKQNLGVFLELDIVPAFDATVHSDVIVSYLRGVIIRQRWGNEPGSINWDHVDRLIQMGYACVNKEEFSYMLGQVFDFHEDFRPWELVMAHVKTLPDPIVMLHESDVDYFDPWAKCFYEGFREFRPEFKQVLMKKLRDLHALGLNFKSVLVLLVKYGFKDAAVFYLELLSEVFPNEWALYNWMNRKNFPKQGAARKCIHKDICKYIF